MRHQAGERVGAILGAKGKLVEFLGYGIYEGDFDPDDPNYIPNPVGDTANMAKGFHLLNPRIKLDNGKIVWGCECWWGNENAIKSQLEKYKSAGFTIATVDIDEVRKPFKG